jgi:cytochrome P450
MSAVSAAEEFDRFSRDPRLWGDPYPIYRRLQQEAPIYYEPWGTWLVTRYADVEALLRQPGLSSLPRQSRRGGAKLETTRTSKSVLFYRLIHLSLLNIDPPDHTRLRALVNKAFTPRVAAQLRTSIQDCTDRLLDPLTGRGHMDLVADFAYPLPLEEICVLLGIPLADRPAFTGWLDDFTERFLAPQREVGATRPDAHRAVQIKRQGDKASQALFDYVIGLAEDRRRQPADDLLSGLVAATADGDTLNDEELVAMCILLLMAGHETTANLIANATHALLRHPAQLEYARTHLPLDRVAIDELFRYDSSIQHLTRRTATEDLDVGGTKVRAGERVYLFNGAANRDPARFADPDALDLQRQDNPHLAFAAGPHYCLGAALARAEVEIALSSMLGRLDGLRLDDGPVRWRQNLARRGPEALALSWG